MTIHQVQQEGNMRDFEDARESALKRIRAEELDRYDAQMTAFELEKADAVFRTEEDCARFGACHVKAWVERWAARNGQAI